MWHIVEFAEGEDSADIVPELWICCEGKKVFWPPYRDPKRVQKAVAAKEAPTSEWCTYDLARIMASAGKNIRTF